MKKYSTYFIIILLILVIAMTALIYQQPSEEYLQLEEEFNVYLASDIDNEQTFIDFVNNLQFERVAQNVKIEIKTIMGYTYQSGVIVKLSSQYAYVLTYTGTIGSRIDQIINIYDYKNVQYGNAKVYASDTTHQLTLLRFFYGNATDYVNIEFPEYKTFMSGEPIAMISNQDSLLNHITMGYYLNTIDDLYYETNLVANNESNGAPIYDQNSNLIGIQVYYNDSYYVLSYMAIQSFLNDQIFM